MEGSSRTRIRKGKPHQERIHYLREDTIISMDPQSPVQPKYCVCVCVSVCGRLCVGVCLCVLMCMCVCVSVWYLFSYGNFRVPCSLSLTCIGTKSSMTLFVRTTNFACHVHTPGRSQPAFEVQTGLGLPQCQDVLRLSL